MPCAGIGLPGASRRRTTAAPMGRQQSAPSALVERPDCVRRRRLRNASVCAARTAGTVRRVSDHLTTTASHQAGGTTTASSALRDVLEATLHYANGKLSQKTDGWAGELDDHEATQGSAEQAGYEGAKAQVQGRNPIWAAIKGAWAGASVELKLAAVLLVVLMLVLAPIPMLLIGLGLLIAAIVKAVRSDDR
jgi:hypothetical protein